MNQNPIQTGIPQPVVPTMIRSVVSGIDSPDVLRIVSAPVVEFDSSLVSIADSLKSACNRFGGVGLSAIQIGIAARVIVVADAKGDKNVYVNPRIVDADDSISFEREGCLSYPGLFVPVKRNTEVTVSYQTLEGEWRKTVAEGLEARCFQHEIDHLDGVIYLDRMNQIMRDAAVSKWKKKLARLFK